MSDVIFWSLLCGALVCAWVPFVKAMLAERGEG